MGDATGDVGAPSTTRYNPGIEHGVADDATVLGPPVTVVLPDELDVHDNIIMERIAESCVGLVEHVGLCLSSPGSHST